MTRDVTVLRKPVKVLVYRVRAVARHEDNVTGVNLLTLGTQHGKRDNQTTLIHAKSFVLKYAPGDTHHFVIHRYLI